MNFSCGLIILVGIGILILGSITAISELGTGADSGNESSRAQTTENVAMPIFIVTHRRG